MSQERVKNVDLLKKVLRGYYTTKEAEDAIQVLKKPDYEPEFNQAIDDIWNESEELLDFDGNNINIYKSEAQNLLQNHINRKHTKVLVYRIISIAAIFIVGFFVSYKIWFSNAVNENLSIETFAQQLSDISLEGGDVQLVLSGNERISIADDQSSVQYNDSGKIQVNTKTIAKKQFENKKQIQYDQLIVPLGKRTTLTFDDGTKLYVNAGTKVIYPDEFDVDKREIYVDGEVYLDVVRDEKRPFIVKTKTLDIRVLGTSFNITAYGTDEESSVVLVSGSVGVKDKSGDVVNIKPNDRYAYANGQKVVTVVDVSDYVSWKEGFYNFNKERVDVILKRLSRYYGKHIKCDERVASYTCSGNLDFKNDLEAVLRNFSRTVPVTYSLLESGEYELKLK